MSLVKSAWTECADPATDNVEVEIDATPPTTGAVCGAPPSTVNTTEPVGTPAPDDTVAENVTLEPNTDGLLSEDTTVELPAAFTV